MGADSDVRDRVFDAVELRALASLTGYDVGWDSMLLYAREVGDERIVVLRYGYNDRVTIGPGGDCYGYAHGWCYQRGAALAVLAAASWDVLRHDEPPYVPGPDGPVGWHKRATDPRIRRAPRRDPDDPLNRIRCVHGRWQGDPCRHCPPYDDTAVATYPTPRR